MSGGRLMPRLRGRLPSLVAWGLLVGGVAILMTFPAGGVPRALGPSQLPAGILYLVAGLVFGLSHPEPRAWRGAALLGWVPLAAGLWLAARGMAPAVGVWLALTLLPAGLAVTAAWVGARVARRRQR